ncbi:Lrp/AsnC family transcriptional regulator [Cupriavidus basilensis]
MIGLPKFDRIDINILAHLQHNSQITNLMLADMVNLSPSPCLTRVKRLEKCGLISGYNARLNIGKLVSHIVVFTEVSLQDHRREDFVRFESALKKHSELQECHLVSGGCDYILKFTTRTIFHYQQIVEKLLGQDLGIQKYFSYIVIKTAHTREQAAVKELLEYGSCPLPYDALASTARQL